MVIEKYNVNTKIEYLSSKCNVMKTENFIVKTQYLEGIDDFLRCCASEIVHRYDDFLSLINNYPNKNITLVLITADKSLELYFKQGKSLNNESVAKNDLVFFDICDNKNQNIKRDARLKEYINSDFFDIELGVVDNIFEVKDEKIYRLSTTSGVNFPLLNKTQLELVETENQNVLASGVAGSGKTNICIDKIIYTACREYVGKVLYSTYSRGLIIDTNKKVDEFKKAIIKFIEDYENKKIVFVDKDIQRAVENKLGIFLEVAEIDKILDKLKVIIAYLNDKVDYYLIEDLYKKHFYQPKIADESVFVKEYISNIKNYQLLKRLEKIKNLSYEVIYKEVYGLIFGKFDLDSQKPMLTQNEYRELRKDSFNANEIETIYYIATDYQKFLTQNDYKDNNSMSRELLGKVSEKYSLVILDEVQDMTEVNLSLMKSISRKMFCVGDAMQMINPSYFSFAYLKRLMFDKDIVTVKELTNNYRNTAKIAELIDNLGEINKKLFGTHSFVLKNKKVNSIDKSTLVFTDTNGLKDRLVKSRLDDCTIIVVGEKEKQELRKQLPNMEILTVADIKGLERNTVLLYNVLSANQKKWQTIERIIINRKQADENSIFRYYYNLLYVALSRAKLNIFVAESKEINLFQPFFNNHFKKLNVADAYNLLYELAYKDVIDEDEIIARIDKFISLTQYDNAKIAVDNLVDDKKKQKYTAKVDIFAGLVRYGKYREAGIKLWENGMLNEAKEQFELSHDDALVKLIDACMEKNSSTLDVNILKFLFDVAEQPLAKDLILDVLKQDILTEEQNQKEMKSMLDKLKEI